uniref:peroxisome proliferator-activated receptor gamma coactivator-related protein 1-like n=1 Tax=Panthera onca TaxID=9690 RepID=UPI002953F321
MLETSFDGHDGPLNKNYPACRIQGAQLRNASLDVSLLEGVPSPDRSSSASWSAGRSRGRRREASPRTPTQVGARMRARGRPCRLETRRGPRALVPREASRSGLSGGSEAGNPLTQSPRARPGTRNVSPSVHLPSFGGKLGTGHGLGEPLKPPPALSASLWPASPGPVHPCPARCISRLGSLCRHLHQPRPHAPCSLPSSSLGGAAGLPTALHVCVVPLVGSAPGPACASPRAQTLFQTAGTSPATDVSPCDP